MAKSIAACRQELRARGVSISEWAATAGVSESLTRKVLTGRRKCVRGESLRIAVLLGLIDAPNVPSRRRSVAAG